MIDFSAPGQAMAQVFHGFGLMMLIVAGGLMLPTVALIGMAFLGGVINQRAVDFAKAKVVYVIIAAVIFGTSGVVARVLGDYIARGGGA